MSYGEERIPHAIPEPAETPTTPQRVLHPDKIRNILSMWLKGMKAILREGMLPRVLISIRVDSHLAQKFQINVTYPGLTTKQALPLICMAADALAQKAKAEAAENGPEIIIPGR